MHGGKSGLVDHTYMTSFSFFHPGGKNGRLLLHGVRNGRSKTVPEFQAALVVVFPVFGQVLNCLVVGGGILLLDIRLRASIRCQAIVMKKASPT